MRCGNATVYIQVFGGGSMRAADALRAPWQSLGAKVPAVEDVLASARAAGRSPPAGHPMPTLVYHGEAMRPCAEALAAAAPAPAGTWELKPLPARLTPQPRTVEVWLPRPASRAP